MLNSIKQLINAHPQTKFFILMLVIYMGALIWTTVQSYARLEYSRSDDARHPIVIQPRQPTDHS